MTDRDDTELPPSEPERQDDAAPERQDDIVSRHLTRAWQSWAPSPDLDARVRARLTSSTAATLGAMGLGAATGAGRPSPWASLQASGKLGALVGAGLVGVGFLSGYLAHSSASPSPEPLRAAPAVVGVAAPSADIPPMVAAARPIAEPPPDALDAPPEPAESSRKRAPRAAPSPAATPSPVSPNEELVLLQRAERAVRADNAALALALIDELEARYPRSTLLEERSAIELLAHCRSGATDASARAARFLGQHPQSLYAGRVRELCPAESADARDAALTKPVRPAHGSDQKEPR
jgi:hypothetical protein